MTNTFNDTLPKSVSVPESYKRSALNSEAIRVELSRWVGWYRKETAEAESPKEQRSEAETITQKLLELYEYFGKPRGMSPDLRALVQECMRHRKLPAPDFARLAMCVKNAGEQLSPVRTGPRNSGPRDNAIRAVFHALQQHSTPKMGLDDARHLAAELVSDSIGVDCPKEAKELRKIIGGN